MAADIFRTALPYIFAAAGGLFTELSGALNIALEGQILAAAFWAVAVTALTGNPILGFAAAMAASSALALLTAIFSFRFRANVFIAALAANLLSIGVVSLFSTLLFSGSGVVRLPADTGSYHLFFVAMSLVTLAGSWYTINMTPFGMRCRAAGLSEIVLYYRGINPDLYRYASFLISGVLCGIAGACLAARIGAFVPNISAGRGWIALVAIYLGYRKIHWVFLSCILFAAAENLANWTQGIIGVPATVILALPYLITLAVMSAVSAYRSSR